MENIEKKKQLNEMESELLSMKNSEKVDRSASKLIDKLLKGINIYSKHCFNKNKKRR